MKPPAGEPEQKEMQREGQRADGLAQQDGGAAAEQRPGGAKRDAGDAGAIRDGEETRGGGGDIGKSGHRTKNDGAAQGTRKREARDPGDDNDREW